MADGERETITGEDSRAPSLTASVVHGLKWSYTSTIVTVILQIGVTAVLARILTPAAFGLVAMATVFLRFGQYFAQMGSGQAVVQRPNLTETDMHTAFTSAVLLGLAFTGLFVLLAPLGAWLFPDAEDVVSVIRVMAVTFTFGGITATTQALLRRRFAFRAVALTEIVSYVFGYALLGLVLAALGAGVWSLVAAALAQAGLAAVIYAVLCRRDLGLSLARGSLVPLYSFGGRVSLIGFAEFIGSNLDTLWTGHFLGVSATGLYSRATNLANLPLYYFTASLSRVLMPAYSRIQAERERLRETYLTTISVAGSLAIPVAWGVAGASEAVVLTLLGDQWVDAVLPLAILSLAVPFTLLTHFGAIICEATAALNVKIAVTVARLVWLAGLLALGSRYGIVGVAAAFALSELITHVAYAVVMRRLLAIPAGRLWSSYVQGLVTGAVVGVTLLGLDRTLSDAGALPVVRLVVAVSVGAVLLLLSITRLRGGRVWAEIRARWRTAS